MKIREKASIAAGTFSDDLNTLGCMSDAPLLVALTGWITVADPTDTSIMQFAINYTDATGNPHQCVFQANPQLIMGDSTQFFTTDSVLLRRVDVYSAFSLDGTLVFGTPASARYTLDMVIIDATSFPEFV